MVSNLGIALGTLTVYIPISTTAILPHFSIEDTIFYLPLFSPKVLTVQDIAMEYVREVIEVCSMYKNKKTFPVHVHHHHSSSSLNLTMNSSAVMGVNPPRSTDRILPSNSRQSLLQKGAERVKQITNTVKKNVSKSSTSMNVKKDGNTTKKREIHFSFSIDKLSIRIQLIEDIFFTYSIQSLVAKYTIQHLLVCILGHNALFSHSSTTHTETILNLPSLPEITVSIHFPQQVEKPQQNMNRGHRASSSTISSITRPIGDSGEVTPRAVSSSNFNSNSGIPIEKKSISLYVDIDLLQVEVLSKDVVILYELFVRRMNIIY